jgi:hypothetical protein
VAIYLLKEPYPIFLSEELALKQLS